MLNNCSVPSECALHSYYLPVIQAKYETNVVSVFLAIQICSQINISAILIESKCLGYTIQGKGSCKYNWQKIGNAPPS